MRSGKVRPGSRTSCRKARRQLEELGIDVTEDQDIVFLQDLLIAARSQPVIEIPGGDAFDLVAARGFQGLLEPFSIVEDFRSLGGLVEGGFDENRARHNGPVADVIDFRHGSYLPLNAFSAASVFFHFQPLNATHEVS
jgi:hypothetical protein